MDEERERRVTEKSAKCTRCDHVYSDEEVQALTEIFGREPDDDVFRFLHARHGSTVVSLMGRVYRMDGGEARCMVCMREVPEDRAYVEYTTEHRLADGTIEPRKHEAVRGPTTINSGLELMCCGATP